jgi:hypothetical protein
MTGNTPYDNPISQSDRRATLHNDERVRKNCYHNNWRVFRALRYLIEAITVPHESAVNCARAVEALRHIIAPNQPRGHAWQTFRSALNISQEYLKMITDVSTGPRHGDPTHIQGTTTTEISRRAWVIMNRFFEYKKRNNQQLPLDIFPLLTA